jgi:hypothetical protein
VDLVVDDKTYWLPETLPSAGDALPIAHMLPPFDEYLVAYTDRSAVLDVQHTRQVFSINGILYPTIVVDGQVVGTWKRTLKKGAVVINLSPFAPLSEAATGAIAAAARRYGAFLGAAVEIA